MTMVYRYPQGVGEGARWETWDSTLGIVLLENTALYGSCIYLP